MAGKQVDVKRSSEPHRQRGGWVNGYWRRSSRKHTPKSEEPKKKKRSGAWRNRKHKRNRRWTKEEIKKNGGTRKELAKRKKDAVAIGQEKKRQKKRGGS